MKRIIPIIITVLLATHVMAQESMTLSLDECIDVALKNSVAIKNAQASYDISRHKVGEILADGLPQVNASADLGYNFKLPTTFIPAKFFGGEPGTFTSVQFSPAYNGNASIRVDQMIFNGSYFIGLKASRTYTDLSKKDHIKSKIDVVEMVSRAYYLVLVNSERRELIEKNYQRLDSLLHDTQVMYDNGFAERIDVDRIKVQFNNIKVELDNYENALDLSKALLKFQMGIDVNTNLELKDNLDDVRFEVVDPDYGADFNYTNRIEYSILQTNLDLVHLDIKNTQVRYMPTLDLYGAYGASTGTSSFSNLVAFGDNWFGYGTVGVRLNVPIFDGFRKSKMIQQKKLQAEQIENSQDMLKKNIDVQILQAKTNLERNIDNLAAQRENLELADNVYKVTKIKYEEGVGSNIEVIEADATYKQAQINYYDALYNALIAKVDLEKAYGKLNQNQTEN